MISACGSGGRRIRSYRAILNYLGIREALPQNKQINQQQTDLQLHALHSERKYPDGDKDLSDLVFGKDGRGHMGCHHLLLQGKERVNVRCLHGIGIRY